MRKPEFDQYAEDYDKLIDGAIPGALNESGYFSEYKVALMAAALRGKRIRRILDFGCGAGHSLPYLVKYFPNCELWGYDVSPESLKIAAALAPSVRLSSDWPVVAHLGFDCMIAANVFHHIIPNIRLKILKQCHEALDEGGCFFLFEHNPLNPATRWVFERCPFDADAQMLSLRTARQLAKDSGFSSERHAYTLFFPRPLAYLRRLEPLLKRIPLGAQYYVKMEK